MSIACLTTDEAGYALALTEQCLEVIEKKESIPFEGDLLSLVYEGWLEASAVGLDKTLAYINSVAGTMTAAELQAMLELLRTELGAKMSEPMRAELSDLFEQSYALAKKTATASAGFQASFSLVDEVSLSWLSNHHLYWIENYFDRHLSEQISSVVASGMKEGLGRAEIGGVLQEFFESYPGVAQKPATYWRGLAANAMNRSRNFGLISGYEDGGIDYLKIVAVLDEKTSPVCFAAWTPIATIDGDKRIDQIAPGDKVLTGSGVYRTVVSSSSRMSHSWVSMRLSSGYPLTVTPEHPILTIEGWKPAGQLLKGDQLVLQESSNENMRKLRQGVSQLSPKSGSEVLFARMLLCGQEQGCLDHSGLRALRQGIPSATLLCDSRKNPTLQQGMPNEGWMEGSESEVTYSQMQDLRQNVQNKAHRVSFRQDEETFDPRCWLQPREVASSRSERSSGEKSPEAYLRCATGTTTVVEVRRVFSSAALPAYNLEVNDDPTYIAQGVVVHNCREMNGKIIPVARAAGQRDQLINSVNPDAVKLISPWLSLDKIEGKPTDQIMDQGMIMPPFHFHCRTTVIAYFP